MEERRKKQRRILDEWYEDRRIADRRATEPAHKVELKPRKLGEAGKHLRRVTRPVDWPTDDPDVDDEQPAPASPPAQGLARPIPIHVVGMGISHTWGNCQECSRVQPIHFSCKARQSKSPEPQDCSWPTCGCDLYADRVIAALEESGEIIVKNDTALEWWAANRQTFMEGFDDNGMTPSPNVPKALEAYAIYASERDRQQPAPASPPEKIDRWLVGNLLDMWDGMANDTKDLIRETEAGFYNAVEAFRPKESDES